MKDRSKIIFGAANGAMFAVFMLVFLAIVNEGLTLATIAGAIVAGVLFGVGIAVFMGGRLEQVRTATKALSVDKIREFETLYQNEEMPREKDKQEYLAYLKASRKTQRHSIHFSTSFQRSLQQMSSIRSYKAEVRGTSSRY